jgi:hypothetical protein
MTGKCPRGFRVFAQWHERLIWQAGHSPSSHFPSSSAQPSALFPNLLLGALHFAGFDPANLFAKSFRSNPPPDIRLVLDSLFGDAIR